MGSPADTAGIKAGDIILSVDGKSINDPRDLALQIASKAPNTTVNVSVWRNGMTQDIAVKLGTLQTDVATPASTTPRPPANGGTNSSNGGAGRTTDVPRQGTAIPELGLSVAAARDRTNGVDIFDVAPAGPADDAGLSNGDVLLSIGSTSVSSAADVKLALDTAKQKGDHSVLLRIQSGQSIAFLAIPLG
jgi:serine protease Do